MKTPTRSAGRAAKFYALLLRLYPESHRRAFGDQMLRTFKDQHHDLSEHRGDTGLTYWLAIIGDETRSSTKERIVGLSLRHLLPKLLLFGAFLLVASSFFWMRGFIVYVKIPAVLLLLIGLVVTWARHAGGSPRPSSEQVWRREGLRNGTILGLLWVVLNILGNLYADDSTQQNTAKLLDVGIILLGMPVLFGLAGYISGRRSRSIADGTFAGILAAVVAAVIMVLSLVVIMLLFWSTVRDNAFQSAEMIRAWHASGDKTFDRYLWVDNLNGALAYTLIMLIFGVLLGTFGGALGALLPTGKVDSELPTLVAGDGLA